MAASNTSRLYQTLLALYPRSFRDEFGYELTQLADDLLRARGVRAWGVLLNDLAVSVPRTRAESLMRAQPNPTQLTVALAALSMAAFTLAIVAELGRIGDALAIMVGATALLLAAAQRSTLSRILDRPEGAPALTLRTVLGQAWWAPPAALHGVGTLWLAANVDGTTSASLWLGVTVSTAFALTLLGGLVVRPARPAIGSAMILFGSVWLGGAFWMVWPPLLAVTIWIGVIASATADHRRLRRA